MLKRFPRFIHPRFCIVPSPRIVSSISSAQGLALPVMASSYSTSSSPFTQAVVASMRRLYPEALADKSFDNTGLLLEAPSNPARKLKNSVLLTIDLTQAVADEAIENKHSVVVAYHPIIFRGLKAITLGDSQQASLLRLAANGISVYSPHTAVDTVPGGMADWLCDIVTGKLDAPEPEAHTAQSPSQGSDTDVTTSGDSEADPTKEKPKPKPGTSTPAEVEASSGVSTTDITRTQDTKSTLQIKQRPQAAHRTYSRPAYPTPPNQATFHPATIQHKRKVVTPSQASAVTAANHLNSNTSESSDTPDKYTNANTGAGRLITFITPQPLTVLITRIAHAIGLPKGFSVAIPQRSSLEEMQIRTVAVCPGSGASVLRGTNADLVFTGEVSHHEALAVIERGGCVIALFHSNSERGYLEGVMRELLRTELQSEWDARRKEAAGKEEESQENGFEDESVAVEISLADRDPFGIVVLEESKVEGVSVG